MAPREHPAQAPWAGPAAYAGCAACHLADGGGRPDGAIPRLAGQRAAVIAEKLARIADGRVALPAMSPFARALAPEEIEAVAAHLEALPAPASVGVGAGDALARGAALYGGLCAPCHGAGGEGRDDPPTPAVCGQHAGYIDRRLEEIARGARADADPAMAAQAAALPPADRAAVADHLARSACPPRGAR